jgi:LmbE family N-acetylglucosaminyl deacetylase
MSVAVLSTHLDDAVLSIGGRIASAARRAGGARVVTVLAGDPSATGPAGPWDTESGFGTAGEAARARRDEDLQACAVLGAEPVWLPYGDEQYNRGAGDGEIWAATVGALRGADVVLAPGSPLTHPDHRWLTGLVLAHRAELPRLGVYAEQPYSIGKGAPRDRGALAEVDVPEPSFASAGRSFLMDRLRRRARRCYRSQLAQLGRYVDGTWRDLEREIGRWERRRGREPVAWISDGVGR